jgi:hypothetical protein
VVFREYFEDVNAFSILLESPYSSANDQVFYPPQLDKSGEKNFLTL